MEMVMKDKIVNWLNTKNIDWVKVAYAIVALVVAFAMGTCAA